MGLLKKNLSLQNSASNKNATTITQNKTFFNIDKAACIALSSLTLTLSVNAVSVKLGSDSGSLVFVPDNLTISSGETVEFVNNVGFPHNVVFDEDNVPEGVNAESLSHEDFLNAPGETVSTKFDKAGTYGYYCEPHRGAGMQAKIIVQ